MNLNNNIYIKKSKIEGKGVFAKLKFNKNKRLGIGIDHSHILPRITEGFGTMINHSYNPNCRLSYNKGLYYVTANRHILKDEEITINYNNTPWYIANAEEHFK